MFHVCRGFSLIELVVVVMIIGVLGGIAIPRLSRGSEGARINAFVAEINTFAKVIDQYRAETDGAFTDPATGVFPSELKGYLDTNSWQGETPLGGEWDIEVNDSGVGLAVGAHYQRTKADARSMKQIDGILDDDDLTSGAFQALSAERYYLILEY